MRVVAVDPGGTTGVAVGVFLPPGEPVVRGYEYAPMLAVQSVEHMLRDVDFVVCESFVPRPGVRTWQPDALEVIGALRYICWEKDVNFALQTPAHAKRFSTDAKLKRLGWHTPSKGGHANDALRHLLLVCVRTGIIDPVEVA